MGLAGLKNKKMITVITGGKTYRATLKEDESGYAVNVFLSDEKMPIFGTRFGLMASFEKKYNALD